MKKLLKLIEQSLLPLTKESHYTEESIYFKQIDCDDFVVVVTERECGKQYPIGTKLRVAEAKITNFTKGTHLIITLKIGVSIIRSLSEIYNEEIKVYGVEDNQEMTIKIEEISNVYVIKSLYYRSDM